MIVNGARMNKMTHDGYLVTRWFHNGVNIWNYVVDTAITLLTSSASAGNPCYAYQISKTIYEDIDMSLFKGVQYYVDNATINALHTGGNASINVVAYEGEEVVGQQTIASGWVDWTGKGYESSSAKKTLTLEFTKDVGMATLKVVGTTDGTPSSKAAWALKDAVLLARWGDGSGGSDETVERVIWEDLAFSNSRNESGSYSVTKEAIQNLSGFNKLDLSVTVSFNGLYRGSNDYMSLLVGSEEYVLVNNEWLEGEQTISTTIDISKLSGEHTITLYVKSNAASDYYYGWFSGHADMKIYK